MAIRDIIEGLAVGAAVGTGDDKAVAAFREKNKLQRRIDELKSRDLLFETSEAAAQKIDQLKQQGVESNIKFDPNLSGFVIDSVKAAKAKKREPALFASIDEINRTANKQGLNVKKISAIDDPKTGATVFTAEFGSDVGAQNQNKRRDKLLDDANKAGLNITSEQMQNLGVSEQIDFINTQIAEKSALKRTASQEKRDVELQDLERETNNLITLFGKAQTESKDFSGFVGDEGLAGRLAGFAASGSANIGLSPNLSAYNRKRKAFATVAAKAAGEVRPTDQDITRFVATLPAIHLSDEENDILMEQLKVSFKDPEKLAKRWMDATGKSVPQIKSEDDALGDGAIKPTNSIMNTTKGKFQFVGFDKETGAKQYKKVA